MNGWLKRAVGVFAFAGGSFLLAGVADAYEAPPGDPPVGSSADGSATSGWTEADSDADSVSSSLAGTDQEADADGGDGGDSGDGGDGGDAYAHNKATTVSRSGDSSANSKAHADGGDATARGGWSEATVKEEDHKDRFKGKERKKTKKHHAADRHGPA